MKKLKFGPIAKVSAFILSVAVICVIIGGISYAADEKYDKDYSIKNILSDYQFAVEGNATLKSHTVGAVVIGGEAKIGSFGDGAIAPSYFKNLISFGNYSKSQYLAGIDDYKDYAGNIPAYYKKANYTAACLTKYDGNGDFFDFDEAYEQIEQESTEWANASSAKVLSNDDIQKAAVDSNAGFLLKIPLNKNKNIVIPKNVWKKADFVMLCGIDTIKDVCNDDYTISIMSDDVTMGGEYQYVSPKDSKKAVFIEASKGNGAKNFETKDTDTYGFLLDDAHGLMKSGASGAIQGGQMNLNGMQLIWNMPVATSVTTFYLAGHVVAPKADVTIDGGNFEGGYIARTIESSAEAHFYPYRKVKKPSETPIPKPTSTLAPKPTSTPKVTSTPNVTPTGAPTSMPKVTSTPNVTPTGAPTSTPKVTSTPDATATPNVTPTGAPTSTPNVTSTPNATPTEAPTSTPKVTSTPNATPTEAPTSTPMVTTKPSAVPTVTPTATPLLGITTLPPQITSSETPEVTATPTIPESTSTPIVTSSADPDVTLAPTATALATINDEDTPTTSATEEPKATAKATPKSSQTTILDEDVPLSDSAPKTGDTTNLFVPILGMGVSLFALLAIMVYRKKRS